MGGWRKLCNEVLHILIFSPDIVRLIKSRKMRGAWNVAHVGGKDTEFCSGNEGKNQLGSPK
jgi:hypothetical protein